MALTDKLTSIADAIRAKTGKTDKLTLAEMPGEISGIETGGGSTEGVRRIQFTVTLEADSLYLPLDGLDEIPEMLTADCYDAEMINATSGYGSNSVIAGKIVSAVVTVLPLKLINNNTGTRVRLQSSSYLEYQAASNLRGQAFYANNSDRHDGAGIGWVNPANSTDAHWQSAFVTDVARVGYALDGDNTLCLYNQHNNGVKFAGGIPYLVTALYDTIPSTADGYATIDRAVNAANVTTTVPEVATE